jgi:hypothetical protein
MVETQGAQNGEGKAKRAKTLRISPKGKVTQ